MRFTLALLSLFASTMPVCAQDSHEFQIGNVTFAQTEIVDARGLPEIDGSVSIMITLDTAGAQKLEQLTRKSVGKPLPITLDGKLLMSPIIREPLLGGSLIISGLKTDVDSASHMAKQISGKDPLPDLLEVEETP